MREKCPDCGKVTRWYHHFSGVSRLVCEERCQGWKVLRKWDRNPAATRVKGDLSWPIKMGAGAGEAS